MTFFDSLILGIIQGITEFFPISSSAHLQLAKIFLKLDYIDPSPMFDLACHMGTFLVCLLYLQNHIFDMLKNDRKRIFYFILAILPLFPAYFCLKPIREYFSSPHFLGLFLILSSCFLFITSYYEPKQKNRPFKIIDMLFIGVMQTIALIPGISRSGSTISAACWRGWQLQEAVLFSFLLAIPTVMGGCVLESYKSLTKVNINTLPIHCYIGGFITSFIIGNITIRYIFSLGDKKRIKPFAWYCLILGIISILWLI